jgi:hypothetical protein
MAEQYHTMSDEEMLKRLRVVFKRKGRLSFGIINEAAAIPSTATYVKRFGSLRKLYALVGYRSPRNCDWIDAREHWSDVLRKHAVQIAEALNSSRDVEAIVEERGRRLTVNGTNFSFFTARQLPKPKPTYLPQWRAHDTRILDTRNARNNRPEDSAHRARRPATNRPGLDRRCS